MRKELCPTSQREIELSNYRDFERAEAIVLTSLTS